MSVTKGSIKQILNSEIDGNECTLQIIDLIDKGSGKFKVELTDGEGKCTGMIKATDDNKPVNVEVKLIELTGNSLKEYLKNLQWDKLKKHYCIT